MKKGYLLLLFVCLFAVPAFGITKHENYIGDNDVQGWMYSYYGSWTPGSAPNGGAKNENFYIGRVRPLKRFTNEATQVIQDNATQITRRKNRGMLWWCPINEGNGGWTSLPRYNFDSEAFSTWSYVTIHGNWTQGFLRQPGAFADVCHKNGVLTACVSAAPWAVGLTSSDGSHGQNYQALIDGGADKLLKLFRYYGIDGLGFNSEQDWGMRSGMKTLLQNCHTKKATYGMSERLHFDFYQLSDVLGGGGGSTDFSDFFPSTNGFFLNYNWGSSQLSSSQSNATAKGGSTFDVYAGMDMQGRSAANWVSLNDYNISIGIWGAHNKCMPYEGATEDGSTPDAIQNCYLRKCEQFFTGGTRNPVNNLSINNTLCSGNASFFGVSKLMAAKSALSWQVNDYFPFISYMNLGNGKFFNNEGQTTYNDEWYNLGVQDHLPTWRWWITTSYMGRTTAEVPSDTHAKFTYEDAWFGGSCLKLTFDNAVGARAYRFIQMYKTQFPIQAGTTYKIRVRYKALKGKATMAFAMSTEGSESTAIYQSMGTMDAKDWTVLEANLTSELNNKTIAQLGMRFNSVDAGTEILIGEVALVKQGITYNPVAPDLTDAELFKLTSRGVDFRVIWDCPLGGSSTSAGEEDVFSGNAGGGSGAGGGTSNEGVSLCLTDFGTKRNTGRYTSRISIGSYTSSTLQTGASSEAVYFDKRSDKVTVTPGQNVTLNVTVTGYWMTGTVFVDWNNDGTFASTEIVSRQATGANNIQTSYSFTIPSTQAAGTYTLRFIMGWEHTDGCSQYGSDGNTIAANGGCVADFTLNVASSTSAPAAKAVTARNAWEPIYNDEVGAWYFEVFAQQEGGEPQLVTATTSWAAYAVDVPFDLNASDRVRIGVRTVAPDGVTKSDIAWTTYEEVPTVTVIEGFSVDKPVIKANEDFTISFDDPNHGNANFFKIYNAKTNAQVGSTFYNVTEFTSTLSEIGLYDVECSYVNQSGATVVEKKRGMIQVSSDEVGAMPIIYTLTTDKEAQNNEITNNEVVTLSYTGRPADGTTSRALRLQEKPFCVQNSQFFNAAGIGTATPITISFWFNPLQFIDAGDAGGNTGFGDQGTQMLNIRKPTDGWPTSDWGYMWSGIHNGGNDYWVNILKNYQTAGGNYTTMTQNFVIPTANWTHVAISIVGSNTNNKDVQLYINGRKVSDAVQNKSAVATLSSTHYIFMGGTAFSRSGFDGLIDEFQIWTKQFDESTINQTMVHYNAGQVPNELICYWDFELDATSDNRLVSRGSLTQTVYAVVGQSWRAVQGEGDGVVGSDPMVESNRMSPTFGAGTPFLAGRYEVKTTPSWKFDGVATPGAVTGNAESGNTTVSWASMEGAPYTATLTLANSWGEDVKSVTMVDACVKLDEVGNVIEDLNVYPNPFAEEIHVRFIEAGDYELDVFSLSGQLIQTKQLNVNSHEVVGINLNAQQQGTYVVRLKKDGKFIKSFKLEKK